MEIEKFCEGRGEAFHGGGNLAAQASEHARVRSGHATAISARKINKGHQLSAACPESQTCDGSITPFET